MKTIALTQGLEAIVDDADYEWLMQWKWCANKAGNTHYAIRSVRLPNGKQTNEYMHRAILGLEKGDRREGDHINHEGLDNRRANIRIVTKQENRFNQKHKGHWWVEAKHKWVAQIQVNGRSTHIGYFDTANKARRAYLRAKATYHVIRGHQDA